MTKNFHTCLNQSLICLTAASINPCFLRLNNSQSGNNSVIVSSNNSTGDKSSSSPHKSDRMTGLFQQSVHPLQTTPNSALSTQHKMASGIRRTVSSAAPSSGMGSVNGASATRSVTSANGVVKSLSSNTQSPVASRTSTSHITKDPHKKLDRSFSEPAEKKNSSSSGSSASLGPSSRYKTELCRSFQEVGSCKYGDKCQFAHGEEELRTVTRHPKFKTENCKSFHSTGFCPYGPRCHFIHNNEEQKKCAMLNNLPTTTSNAPNNMPSTPSVIGQRISFDSQMSVMSGQGSATSPPVSAGPVLSQPAFPTTSPINNHPVNLVRPKALSLGSYSLGSSGEISSPSSQSGSPTSLNSFFTEDSFGLGTFSSNGSNSRISTAVNAFQSSSTFSFSPDSAFVSFNGAASNGSSAAGSSLSFNSNPQKCFFGGSQPTLNSCSRFSPEPVMNSQEETTNSVIFSLFNNPSPTAFVTENSHFNEFFRSMSPIGKSMMLQYPSSPESPVDSVASEIEALKLGEQPSASFSPISSSFSNSSLSTSSSPPNGIDLDFILSPGSNHCGNIPSSRLPTFTKIAAPTGIGHLTSAFE